VFYEVIIYDQYIPVMFSKFHRFGLFCSSSDGCVDFFQWDIFLLANNYAAEAVKLKMPSNKH